MDLDYRIRSCPTTVASASLSRRRMLALAAGGATALATSERHMAVARQDAAATPAVDLPPRRTVAADASPEFRTVADALIEAMQRHQVPGAALGILAGDREEHATFGVASMSSLMPVTPETRFQIGSLSKTITSTAIWHLHDRGAFALDTPVRAVVPNLRTADPEVAEAVQIGNLLDHSAGWYGDEGFETGDGDDAIARFVDERLPELPQQFPLGAFFSYNNAAFSLLGRVIETTTGTSFGPAVRSIVTGPLGLDDTILDRAELLRFPYADGHYAGQVNGRDVLTVQTPLWTPRSVDPAGGFWSTTRDVIRYARFHLSASSGVSSGAASVVSAESLLQMREPAIDVPGLPLSMGRDWFVQDIDGVQVFAHNGDTLGQHTEFFAIPEHQFAFVLLTNGPGGSAAALQAVNAALAAHPGLAGLAGKVGTTWAGLAPADTPTVVLPSETIQEYAGRYADWGTEYTVSASGSGLQIAMETIELPGTLQPAIAPNPPAPFEVSFTGKDAGLAAGIMRVPFVRDDAGKVGWMSFGLRLIPRTGDA